MLKALLIGGLVTGYLVAVVGMARADDADLVITPPTLTVDRTGPEITALLTVTNNGAELSRRFNVYCDLYDSEDTYVGVLQFYFGRIKAHKHGKRNGVAFTGGTRPTSVDCALLPPETPSANYD